MVDNEFIKKYDKLIKHMLVKLGVDSQDIHDMSVLVYERLMSHWTYNEERGSFNTWLGYVVRSVVSNHRQKKARSHDALDHSLPLEVASNVIGDEDAGDAKDELTRIFEAAELTRRDEGIMRDIYLEGHTYEEAADRHGMGLEAVKSVVYRAMKALRLAAG